MARSRDLSWQGSESVATCGAHRGRMVVCAVCIHGVFCWSSNEGRQLQGRMAGIRWVAANLLEYTSAQA